MKQSDQLGPKMGTFFIRYSREFVITVIVITEFDYYDLSIFFYSFNVALKTLLWVTRGPKSIWVWDPCFGLALSNPVADRHMWRQARLFNVTLQNILKTLIIFQVFHWAIVILILNFKWGLKMTNFNWFNDFHDFHVQDY